MSGAAEFPADPVRLRPHHLLCLQNYQGKGYDEGFIRNMDAIVESFQRQPDTGIRLVSGCDDVCASCPNRTKDAGGSGQCCTEEKVRRYDGNVREAFSLGKENYTWKELCGIVRTGLTAEKMKRICGDCEWAENGTCPHL